MKQRVTRIKTANAVPVNHDASSLELKLSDGSVHRWTTCDDKKADDAAFAVLSVLGQPHTTIL